MPVTSAPPIKSVRCEHCHRDVSPARVERCWCLRFPIRTLSHWMCDGCALVAVVYELRKELQWNL